MTSSVVARILVLTFMVQRAQSKRAVTKKSGEKKVHGALKASVNSTMSAEGVAKIDRIVTSLSSSVDATTSEEVGGDLLNLCNHLNDTRFDYVKTLAKSELDDRVDSRAMMTKCQSGEAQCKEDEEWKGISMRVLCFQHKVFMSRYANYEYKVILHSNAGIGAGAFMTAGHIRATLGFKAPVESGHFERFAVPLDCAWSNGSLKYGSLGLQDEEKYGKEWALEGEVDINPMAPKSDPFVRAFPSFIKLTNHHQSNDGTVMFFAGQR